MAHQNSKKFSISPITLGTVQLGLNYGIANKTGKPNSKFAYEILTDAISNGINAFDTSPAYGDSEAVMGSFLSSFQETRREKIIVITKIIPETWRNISSRIEIYEAMKSSVEKSLQILGLHKLPFCLLHSATLSDMRQKNGVVLDHLLKLKEEDLVERIGASIYSPEEVKEVLKTNLFDAVQVPINLFDQNLIKTKLLIDLKEHGILVFARSIFLQGLFFLRNDEVPSNLSGALRYLQVLRELSNQIKVPINQIAFNFVRDLAGVTTLVIGVETRDQLRENVALLKSPKLCAETKQKIFDAFGDVPEDIKNPSKWKK